jgi:hypothetical protein
MIRGNCVLIKDPEAVANYVVIWPYGEFVEYETFETASDAEVQCQVLNERFKAENIKPKLPTKDDIAAWFEGKVKKNLA